MNKFFQQLLQQASRSAPVGFREAAKRVAPVARDLTNPATYQALAARAERTLGGALPPQFSGANFGKIPAQAAGLISDVASMPMGLSRIARAIPTAGAIREMAQGAPRVPASIQQAASGALRAPVIGDAVNAGRNIATGLSGALVSPTGFGGPFARDPGLRREFLKQFGGSSQRAADALARSGVNPSAVGGMFRNLGNVSSAVQAIPGPGWAKTLGAGLLGGGTSALGAIGNLAFLEGSSPQSSDPYDRWQQLGYGSKEDMRRRVQLQAQLEGNKGATERFGPGIPNGLMDRSGTALPGAMPPSAPAAFMDASIGGQQAGQQIPSAPPPLGGPGVVSTGAGVPAQRQNVLNRSLSQEVLNAAQQYAAPTSVPLSAFYEGQQQLGRSMMQQGNLVSELQNLGAGAGMTPENFKAWAQQNPDLAYRELLKLRGRQ